MTSGEQWVATGRLGNGYSGADVSIRQAVRNRARTESSAPGLRG